MLVFYTLMVSMSYVNQCTLVTGTCFEELFENLCKCG